MYCETKCFSETQLSPIMANSKMATVIRTNILIKVERSAATTKAYVQYESGNIYYSEVMINVNFKKRSNVKRLRTNKKI